MRFLYTILLYLGLPLVFMRLWRRSRLAPAYAQRWRERFGFISPPAGKGSVIWVHAVSVGETLAALPLINALQQQHPQTRFAVTTTTPTGSERVTAALGDSVFHVYMPYDLPDCVARFLQRVKPKLLIIMETELWPNTIAACHRRNIPVILANARLSEKSARGYRRIRFLISPMLKRLSAVAAQHDEDIERFIALGMDCERCTVTGSIKFDLDIGTELRQRAAQLKREWNAGGQRLVWLAASTHQGEDETILAAFSDVRRSFPDLLLVIVPRHPERFDRVVRLCGAAGWRVARRSSQGAVGTETDIVIGDTMGELLLFLGACDIAFIGGSLTATGGHNLIEPAAWGVPILSGPHLLNFADVSRQLLAAGGMEITRDVDELSRKVIMLAGCGEKRLAMGREAAAVAAANRGALQRVLEITNRYLSV
ncbi:MAG: lipid IV(A) 3-deoxy-D-manno-octulosonic acid transferase [Exilibacterium sp.]